MDGDGGSRFHALQRGPTLSNRVADSMLEMITKSQLRPGDRLPSERDLGQQFGVSRTVVREALRSLAAKGVLEVRSGSGAVVARVDAEHASEALRLFVQTSSGHAEGIDYEQIDDVRELLETRVARIAAGTASAADLRELRNRHQQMVDARDDVEAASACDVAFHRAIAVATQNPLYLIMLDSIAPVLLDIRRRTLGVAGRPELAIKAHAGILERIEARDAEGAEQAMAEHLADSRVVWRGDT